MTHDEEVALWRATLELGDAVERIGKADSEDDHFYGAWSGGSKREGGHPKGTPKSADKPGAVISFDEAESRIIAAGFTRADIRELDPALRAEVTEELERLAKAYPTVMAANFIGVEVGSVPENAYASAAGVFGSHSITLASAWWKTGPAVDDGTQTTVPAGGSAEKLRSALAQDRVKGWSSTGTPAGTVAHEFAHIVDRYVGQHTTGQTYLTNLLMPGMKRSDQGQWQRSGASRYAQTNPSEWFAEVFSAREAGERGGSYEWPQWVVDDMKKAGVKS